MAQNNNGSWYSQSEKSRSGKGYALMLFVLKYFPDRFMRFLAYIIGFFYWIFSPRQRMFSRSFLESAHKAGASFNGKRISTLKHFISFALNLVEILQSWAGRYSFKNVTWQDDDVGDLVSNINSRKGAVCVISHIGNAQMMKGLAAMNEAGTEHKIPITSVVDTKITGGFVRLMEKVNPDSNFHIVSADNIGPETIFLLQERIEQGEIVVIAGDRTGAHSSRYINLPFMGKNANFPYGVFLLIALLEAPTYFIFGLRHKDLTLNPAYNMYVKKNPISFDCGRKEREQRITSTAQNYVTELERHAKTNPYQWYNFFDFWS